MTAEDPPCPVCGAMVGYHRDGTYWVGDCEACGWEAPLPEDEPVKIEGGS